MTQGQGIDKKPYQWLQLAIVAIGHGRTDHQIFYCAVTGEKQRKGRQQRHEQTAVVLRTEIVQPACQS